MPNLYADDLCSPTKVLSVVDVMLRPRYSQVLIAAYRNNTLCRCLRGYTACTYGKRRASWANRCLDIDKYGTFQCEEDLAEFSSVPTVRTKLWATYLSVLRVFSSCPPHSPVSDSEPFLMIAVATCILLAGDLLWAETTATIIPSDDILQAITEVCGIRRTIWTCVHSYCATGSVQASMRTVVFTIPAV